MFWENRHSRELLFYSVPYKEPTAGNCAPTVQIMACSQFDHDALLQLTSNNSTGVKLFLSFTQANPN